MWGLMGPPPAVKIKALSWHSNWLDGYFKAKSLEPTDQPALNRQSLSLIEVVGAQVSVRLIARQQMIGNHQDGMRHGHCCALGSSPALDPGQAGERQKGA